MKYIFEVEIIGVKDSSMIGHVQFMITSKLCHGKNFLFIHNYIRDNFDRIINLNLRLNWHLTFLYNLNQKWYAKHRDKILNQYKSSPIAG